MKKAAAGAVAVDHPWEKEGMPADEKMLAFLRTLPIVSGLRAGETLELLEFQERFVRGVYGNDRAVRLAALSVARGNGKSGLLAGLGLAHLLGPLSEGYGEVYAAALDREQAGVLYRMTRAYIEATPWMAAAVNIKDWHKEIIHEDSQSIWRALTSDARKAHGLAPSFWIADEVAQWKSRELWDNLSTGMGKRRHALGVTISTQAADDHHFFSEMLDAPPSPTIYTQLHTAPAECELDDRDAWAAANPALGTFLNEEQFQDAAERAKASPSFEPAFRLLQLNQRISVEAHFLNAADWKACATDADIEKTHEGARCYLGLDLSATTDLTSLTAFFPDTGAVLSWSWTPGDTIAEAERRDHVPYQLWKKQGHIETVPGKIIDKRWVIQRIADIASRFDVVTLAYDRWGAKELEKLLSDEGVKLKLEPFGQGYQSMSPAIAALETLVLTGELKHPGNPLLDWAVSNGVIIQDPAGNRKLVKGRAIGRIDPLIALVMAVGTAAQSKARKTVYARRGVFTVDLSAA
ncbi:terminase large subunit [Nitratireductor aquimarinus]|uniref:terminase large subunit n=1 Tax=Nitratireductor TaxID=245876 RepID=UPI0019D351F6|nr:MULTISPECIES: terminase TerL endonuclease subunit [Nitratireductor]MBN7776712.1 terminase large subunit [Nitratireductor pacificus]MBN7780046.1 terminase large subunit [Nitratireductor pacificus]MBN7788853.1 terminase large subunit [Nitratireductor aquimarinus]MBY6098921.1 terminase large subunit [Nitratireductor aquimarinus]MCA1259419.1 terminase large subunit [Nitratireductor aquimarinus]